MTIIPIPESPEHASVLVCDECDRTMEIQKDTDFPWPWQMLVLEDGEYHACCEGCGSLLQQRGGPPDSS